MPGNLYQIIEIRATFTMLKKWNKLSLIWKSVRITSLYLINTVFIQFTPLLQEQVTMEVQDVIKT